MKILVVAAHPDDEILGVGGAILKHKKDNVAVLMVTKAYEPEWSKKYQEIKLVEQKAVDRILHIDKRINLDLPTVKLNTLATGELNSKIGDIIGPLSPDIIYTHHPGDLNDDHGLVYKAVLVGSRQRKNKLMTFETLSSTEWGMAPFQPNLWVDISGTIDNKIKAFKIYRSEVCAFPHPRSVEGIKTLAKYRGMQAGLKYAEAFSIIKDFNL